MTTAKAKRYALAAACTTALAGLTPGWTVYAGPPSAPSAPAVVVGPRSPYRVAATYRSDDVDLAVTVLVARAVGDLALDQLDDAMDLLVPAIDALPNATSAQDIDTVGLGINAAGVELVMAIINVTMSG